MDHIQRCHGQVRCCTVDPKNTSLHMALSIPMNMQSWAPGVPASPYHSCCKMIQAGAASRFNDS